VGQGEVYGQKASRRRAVGPLRLADQLRIGETVEATVTGHWREWAAIMDVGTDLPAMLKVEEFTEGFPLDGWPPAVGEKLTVRILNKDRKGFGLTMRNGILERPPRKPKAPRADVSKFAEVPHDQWLDGEVQGMTKWGVFIEVSPPSGGPLTVGMLHKEDIKEDMAKSLVVGNHVSVRVARVNVDKNTLDLTVTEP